MALATYSFLPWARQGLSNAIAEGEGDANASLRPSIDVRLRPRVDAADLPLVTRKVRLYGPGDVLAIDRSAIVNSEPRDWTTNFEPNYLAYVDFYDEDFPWRYTPAHPDTTLHRQRPWIALIVLAEGEFEETKAIGKPAPSIVVKDLATLPRLDELWAWAHVHTDRSMLPDRVVSADRGPVEQALARTVAENPDLAHARLLSPRQLAPNTAYHAFVVPAFESGRVAGLGLDLTQVDQAMRGAWDDHPQRAALSPNELPFYFRWYFRTGGEGDFEQLVRLLVPRPMDARVGQRDLDVSRPAQNLPGIDGPHGDGVLRLGGMLRVPNDTLEPAQQEEARAFEQWDLPRPAPFQRALAAYVNLGDQYQVTPAQQAHQSAEVPPQLARLPDGSIDPDPVVAPPLYGRWQALTQRLLTQRDGSPAPNTGNWLHQLNLDPRHRVAAALGTRVIRDRQESYMKAAWEQVGQVLEANRQIRAAQASVAVSSAWFTRSLEQLAAKSPANLLGFCGPLAARVVTNARTLRKQVIDSNVPRTLLGGSWRRALRPTGRLLRKLAGTASAGRKLSDEVLAGLNMGALSSAQVPAIPSGATTVDELRKKVAPRLPPPLSSQVEKDPNPLLPGSETPQWLEGLPQDGKFHLLSFDKLPDQFTRGNDSEEARRLKRALGFELELRDATVMVDPARSPLDVDAVARGVLQVLHPALTVRARLESQVRLPARIRAQMVESFGEVMAYPRIDEPMYKPLAALGSELFLPNLNLIAQNSLSLLEPNREFIESYMMGLNHELARELLWREYPTDQRGSYMRQCFEVSAYADDSGLDPEARREQLYDVRKLHTWSRTVALGANGNRGNGEGELVLVLRGELLKRYPNAVIYAHRATWPQNGGVPDKTRPRFPVELSEAQEVDPPRDLLKTPLYEAKIDPDITFLGFDLAPQAAKGDPATDDAGWFFVLKERPGEPRFGLDVERAVSTPLITWSDLSWKDVTVQNGQLRPGAPALTLQAPTIDTAPEQVAQHADDVSVRWTGATTSAEVAYVLNQLPVLVAVHASEMLP